MTFWAYHKVQCSKFKVQSQDYSYSKSSRSSMSSISSSSIYSTMSSPSSASSCWKRDISLSRCTRVSSAVISWSLLLSELSSFQSTSFSSWMPWPVTDDMNTTGRSVGRVSRSISMSSSSSRSHLVMASTRCYRASRD